MKDTPEIRDFLAQRRIAVVGVAREPTAANVIYKAMRDRGYEVVAVNPSAAEVEGDVCYPNLRAIVPPPDAVMIAAPPGASAQLVREAAALGVQRAWLHRSLFGDGSFSEEAVAAAKDGDVTVIEGGCPMMFMKPVDPAHACMRWLGQHTGSVPGEDA